MARQIPYWTPAWSKVKGHDVLRVPGSKFAALPTTGKKSARTFSIFNVDDLIEIVQLRKNEVSPWLVNKARDENVKPSGHVEAAKPTPKRKAIKTPQIGPVKRNPTFKTGKPKAKAGARGIVEQDTGPTYTVKQTGRHAGTVQRNPKPGGRQYRKAVSLYRDFTGENPRHVDDWSVMVPPVAMEVGKVSGIMYVARVDGKSQEFLHEFTGKSRPILAASSDGRQLLLLGGDYKMTERGIVDGTYEITR